MILFIVGFVLFLAILCLAHISKKSIFGKLEPAFVGALISASGTIFAGTLAFTVANENLEVARQTAENSARQAEDYRRELNTNRRNNANAELDSLRELYRFNERLLRTFGPEPEKNKNYEFFFSVLNANETGRLINFNGPIPRPFVAAAPDMLQRFALVRDEAVKFYATKPKPNGENAAKMDGIGQKVASLVNELQEMQTSIGNEITHRETEIRMMPR